MTEILLQAQVEAMVFETGVIRFMRISMAKFLSTFCNSDKRVRKTRKDQPVPSDDDLPPELTEEILDAKGTPHRETDVGKYLTTFRYTYQQVRAILKKAPQSDPQIMAFRKIFNGKYGNSKESDHKIALACASFNYKLSRETHQEDLPKKINWKDENAVIYALKSWGIEDDDQLTAARAFHKLKLMTFLSPKKVKDDVADEGKDKA